jgi:hypothetical protein
VYGRAECRDGTGPRTLEPHSCNGFCAIASPVVASLGSTADQQIVLAGAIRVDAVADLFVVEFSLAIKAQRRALSKTAEIRALTIEGGGDVDEVFCGVDPSSMAIAIHRALHGDSFPVRRDHVSELARTVRGWPPTCVALLPAAPMMTAVSSVVAGTVMAAAAVMPTVMPAEGVVVVIRLRGTVPRQDARASDGALVLLLRGAAAIRATPQQHGDRRTDHNNQERHDAIHNDGPATRRAKDRHAPRIYAGSPRAAWRPRLLVGHSHQALVEKLIHRARAGLIRRRMSPTCAILNG